MSDDNGRIRKGDNVYVKAQIVWAPGKHHERFDAYYIRIADKSFLVPGRLVIKGKDIER